MLKPLIGISAYTRVFPTTGWRYDVSYGRNAEAIHEAGGIPLLVPTWLPEDDLRAVYERLDGLLLPGGEDVEPERYGAVRHETVKRTNPQRDEAEITMARWAFDDRLPLFGICRGLQLINVAMGGTLTQDIRSHIATDLRHDIDSTKEPRDLLLHEVEIDADSQLADIVGDTRVHVNSLHHQTIEQLAPGMRVTARATDGIIEAIEALHPEERGYVLAVQWHPEDLTGSQDGMHRLFTRFVDAARERMQRRSALA